MNKQIENIIRNQSSNLSIVNRYKGDLHVSETQQALLSQQLLKNNCLKLNLKNQWGALHFYKYNKKKSLSASSEARIAKFFCYKKEKFYEYNYLILAKLVNLIGVIPILQNRFRQLVKIQTKYLDLEKLLKIKLAQNNIFFSWIAFVLMEQMYTFVQMYSAFLCKSNLIPTKNKVEIHLSGNVLFLRCPDFMMLKWYQNKINVWSFEAQSALQGQETLNIQNNNNFSIPSQMNTIYFNTKNIHRHYLQNKANNIYKQLLIKTYSQWIPKCPSGAIQNP